MRIYPICQGVFSLFDAAVGGTAEGDAEPWRGNKVVRLTGGREFSFSSFVLTKEEKETKRRRKTTRGGLSHVVAEPAMARAASVRPHSHGSLLLSPRSDSRAGAPPLWTPPFKNDHTGAAAPMWRTPGERPHIPCTGRTPGRPAPVTLLAIINAVRAAALGGPLPQGFARTRTETALKVATRSKPQQRG